MELSDRTARQTAQARVKSGMRYSEVVERAASRARARLELWTTILNELNPSNAAEIGVFRGEFAQCLLTHVRSIHNYYMVDPWRHLEDWNKPWNKMDEECKQIRNEALCRTEFAAERRIVLEGRTTEVSASIPDRSLDFAYIDGDHTLRGITVDLIRMWPKMRIPAILAGDDFVKSVWAHPSRYEPTLVFPLAIHFAEAVGTVIYALPFDQFAILVEHSSPDSSKRFEFRDLTNTYKSTTLREALRKPGLRTRAMRKFGRVIRGHVL